MKKARLIVFRKSFLFSILILLGFSLQSFDGVRIQKRHYRKGYYVHICNHKCKVKLDGATTTTTTVAVHEEKSEAPLENSNSDVPSADRVDETGKTQQISAPPVSIPQQIVPTKSITPISKLSNAPKN